MVRKRFGLRKAQVILGHAKADMTERYAERDLSLAEKVSAASRIEYSRRRRE